MCAEKNKLMSVHLRRAEKEAISILKNIVLVGVLFIGLMGAERAIATITGYRLLFFAQFNMVTNEKSKKKNCI